jgi:CRISPR-associated protein Csm4
MFDDELGMKRYDVVKMNFQSALHLSKGKGSYESGEPLLHSDTLKAALFAAAVESGLNVQTDGQPNAFLDSFRVSSAFPFYKDEYFFPKPVGLKGHKIVDAEGVEMKKAGKNLRFIGKSLFEDMICQENSGKNMEVAQKHLIHEDEAGQVFSLASESISKPERDQADFYVFRRFTMMRVVVPRVARESDPEPYYMEQTFFHPDGGLYFLIDWPENETFRNYVETALHTLQDNGLGLDRNTGNGQFEWEKSSIDLHVPDTATHQVLLSLYCPAQASELSGRLEQSAYTLIKRGGYVSSSEPKNGSYRKQSVYMMAEGSTLYGQAAHFEGRLHDLKPAIMADEHPVWREGRPFLIPCYQPSEQS